MGRLRWARQIAALLAVLALGLMFAPVAAAGGPTSVMIIEYPQGKATALRVESKAYQDLHRLMQAGPPLQGSAKPPAWLNPDQPPPHSVRMTWFLHDVRAWQTDLVYFGEAPEDVWIHSQADHPDATTASGSPQSADSWLASEGVWRQPTDGPELRKLLGTLGLSFGGGSASAAGATPDVSATSATPALSPVTSATASSPGPGENWWWSLPGLVVGAAIALLVRSGGRRFRSSTS
ncbi:hypothetical protein [Streptomyces sp. NPDC048057]|uniref:hypothetical protein n=1 Tax=Streptomyces sp. NPDC048057 TaxID=3155628 RepID=UPI0033E1D6BA